MCVAVHAQNNGWASGRGAQFGKPLDRPSQMELIRVDPERVDNFRKAVLFQNSDDNYAASFS